MQGANRSHNRRYGEDLQRRRPLDSADERGVRGFAGHPKMRQRYWLMKSEPDAFSIDDLARAGTEPWNGVRNYQARNFMRDQMQVGDGVLFYHSNTKLPGIVGIARVASAAYPDDTQFDPNSDYFDPKATREQPRWSLVDVTFERKFAHPISLATIKQHADALGEGFPLTARGNRLSVFPVTAAQWALLLGLEEDAA